MKSNVARTVNRRQFLQATVGTVALASLAACIPVTPAAPLPSADSASAPSDTAEPKRGGLLRTVVADDATSLDPGVLVNSTDVNLSFFALQQPDTA
ncbi:MAG: twin-arginine translocation signal domain-containing protein [Caldilineaceae bacterium]|nr:twin-arginine translocation signal domain-containing protein [Caldilineaceae bacterium]